MKRILFIFSLCFIIFCGIILATIPEKINYVKSWMTTINLYETDNYNIVFFDDPYIVINHEYASSYHNPNKAMIYNDELSIEKKEGYYFDDYSVNNIEKIAKYCYQKDSLIIYRVKKKWAKEGFRIFYEYNIQLKPFHMAHDSFNRYEAPYYIVVEPWRWRRVYIKSIFEDIVRLRLSLEGLIHDYLMFSGALSTTVFSYPIPSIILFDNDIEDTPPYRFIRDKDFSHPIMLPDDYYNCEDVFSFPPIRVESETDAFTETGINVHGYDVYEDPGFDINDYQLRLTRSEENKLEYVGTLVKRQN